MSSPRRSPGTQHPSRSTAARRPKGGRRGTDEPAGAGAKRAKPAGHRGKNEPGRQRRLGAPPPEPTARRAAGRAAGPAGGPRGGRRPGVRRTAASAPDRRRFSRRGESRLTGRAAILAIVLSVLVLTLAYPVQQYLAQRSRIAAMEQNQSEQQQRVDALQKRKDRWDDPAYVKQQAKRLQLVEPGERSYVLIPDPKDAARPDGSPAEVVPQRKGTWYGQLWGSVRDADEGRTGG